MNFSALHQQVKQQTDASLLTLIDELPDYAPRLKDAMRHALLAGGKRMRPLLVQVVGNTLDVPKKDQMAISMAIECVHAYSLVHDDLPAMDKALVGKVEKAIRESGLGINPQLNGTIIMLPIPELNEERRTQLTKVAGQYAESARVSIRNVRRDGMDQIKKAKADGMSEDDQKVWEGEVQDMTNKFIAQIDEQLESKQAEIMQV